MVSAVDRSNELRLLGEDFHRAKGWLEEAEQAMPTIFESGVAHSDSVAMDELVAWIARQGNPVAHYAILRHASRIFPNYAVMKVFDMLALSGRIEKVGEDVKGYALYLPAED